MYNEHWKDLKNLIIVAGHAVYVAENFDDPLSDSSWCLQEFQKGEPPFYIEHIYHSVELANKDKESLLIFSGGQTRKDAGPKSEAQSYWLIADHYKWWFRTNVKLRTTTEEFARDSFENVLFSICRFKEATESYPEKITVVSWAFKKERFELHRRAIKFPNDRFIFEGVNNPVELEKTKKGEKTNGIDLFSDDLYGSSGKLAEKRKERNPFNRQHNYVTSCSELKDLLEYNKKEIFAKNLPW